MSDCPYFDTSHSMAVLCYVCKAGKRPRKISSKDISKNLCLADKYLQCRHYPDKEKKTKETGG